MDSKNHKDTSQNRLLVATGVLTFLYFAGAHFTALSVVGATVTFTNEDALVEFAWVIWFYYYVRTYQYYKEEGLKVFDNAMERTYSASFGHLLVDLTPDEFDLLDDDDAIKASIIRLGFRDRAGLLKRAGDHEPLKRVRQARTDLLQVRRGHFNLLRKKRFWRRIPNPKLWIDRDYGFVAVVYPPADRFTLQGQHKYFVPLPFWIPFRLLTIHLHAILFRPHFTENQGPLVIGLAPVWYAIFMHWQNVQTLGHWWHWVH